MLDITITVVFPMEIDLAATILEHKSWEVSMENQTKFNTNCLVSCYHFSELVPVGKKAMN